MPKGTDMSSVRDKDVRLQSAAITDLAFARELTRVNMREYYSRYDLIWQPEAFDGQWPSRQNFLVYKAGKVIGYLGVTEEHGYLYVRDVQLIEAYRGEGVGAWIMARVFEMAVNRGCRCLRLKVFKNNPAIELYRRLGYTQVGEEQALFWMECEV